MPRLDDETLMAHADGQLDAATSADIERSAAEDADLADRLATFSKSRELVRSLFAPLVDAPVPATLVASVSAVASTTSKPGAASVVELTRTKPRPTGSFLAAAMAAGLAALVAGPVGYYLGGAAGDPDGLRFDRELPQPVAAALNTLASGAEFPIAGLGRLRLIATFKDVSGALCREFEIGSSEALVAVACRSDDSWRIAFAVEAPRSDGYAPASSLAALDAYLAEISSGEPMSLEVEAEALRLIE